MTDTEAGAPIIALQDDELKDIFRHIGNKKHVVVAVSGGPDSMALMAAVARFHELYAPDLKIHIATVDHGLREESRQEAEMVKDISHKLGLPFHLLTWTGEKPETGIQEMARDARYGLLLKLCHDLRADFLLTAHTLDDQAETFMMRMARGSGLSGLQAMRIVRDLEGVKHIRPLLHISKQRLIATCEKWDIPFINDPSNVNDHYTRVRWRKLLPVLADEGLTAQKLMVLSERIERAENALDQKATEAFERALVSKKTEDNLELDFNKLRQEPEEIILRVLVQAILQVSGKKDHLRLQRVEGYIAALLSALENNLAERRTLGGVMLFLKKNSVLTLAKEPVRQRGRGAESH
ncbi:tRNA lysidine(34) synthetase TilS [Microvirga sp. W0021]|uniref:tRNA(Ile)-lysidine synthase n=1 Tax=Hohaiivirga grylli TaxID=3133970 RepID=A0ABV0BK83_9HYPH